MHTRLLSDFFFPCTTYVCVSASYRICRKTKDARFRSSRSSLKYSSLFIESLHWPPIFEERRICVNRKSGVKSLPEKPLPLCRWEPTVCRPRRLRQQFLYSPSLYTDVFILGSCIDFKLCVSAVS